MSLVVPAGSVVALLGPNGGGKTTMLNVCAGTLTPTAGEVPSGGNTSSTVSADGRARRGMCTVPEGPRHLPEPHRAGEPLDGDAGGRADGPDRRGGLRPVPPLGRQRKQLAGTLSGGEQQMLALARARLRHRPEGPPPRRALAGLGPIVVVELYEKVRELASGGLSILLVEQFARTALPIADTAAVVLQGVIVHRGSPAEMEDALSASYLGG